MNRYGEDHGGTAIAGPDDRSPVSRISAALLETHELLARVNATISEAIGDTPPETASSASKPIGDNGTLNAVARRAGDIADYVNYTHGRIDALRRALSE